MKKHFPLTKIGFFNPARLSDEEIELTFVARTTFFEHILKKIVGEKKGSIPQHHLIIGQRGMGKSSLLLRIAAELRKEQYTKSFIALSFPEEQYNIDRLSKFWLNCMDALADALDREGKSTELSDLDKDIEKLFRNKSLTSNEAYEIFINWTKKLNRRPVLLVDNLNLIFSKISTEDQHLLRGILIETDAPILIGTSATTIEETIDYKAPFYDAFAINYLKKLSFKESLEVLINLAKITGNDALQDMIHAQRGRIEAMYQLTGGTPRTLTILFPMIQDGFSENIQTDLDSLLDIITPLYKARFEELPDQQQVVLDAVALNWDPVNLEDLRERTMLDNAKLSPQLKRLVDLGWLEKIKNSRKGGDSYEISERFFNVWYLMRRSSRRQKRELYCLTKFLETFYGTDLNNLAQSRMLCKSAHANHIALDLALADALKENKLSIMLRNKGYNELIDMSLEDDRILKEFSIPQDVAEQKMQELFSTASEQMREKDFQAAKTTMNKALNLDQNNLATWMNIGFLENQLKDFQKACKVFEKAIQISKNFPDAYRELGRAQAEIGEVKKAEKNLHKAIELASDNARNWNELGNIYRKFLFKYKEAEEAYLKAAELDLKSTTPRRNLAIIYMDIFYDFKSAEKILKQITEINPKEFKAWYNLGKIYFSELGDIPQALFSIRKALKINPKSDSAWSAMGIILSEDKKIDEAKGALEKALKINPKSASAWNTLGHIYAEIEKNYPKSESAYKKAISAAPKIADNYTNLGHAQTKQERFGEAEENFLKAISINPKDKIAWRSLTYLYLHEAKDIKKAAATLKKFQKEIPDDVIAWYYQGELHSKLEEFEMAEKAFLNSVSIDTKFASGWSALAYHYIFEKENLTKAEKMMNKALEIEPDNDSFLRNIAFLYFKMEKYVESANVFERILDINNESQFAYTMLGIIYLDKIKDIQKSILHFRNAVKFGGKEYLDWLNLGMALSELPESEAEAEAVINRAIEMEPNDDASWFYLGYLLSNIPGRLDDAIVAYRNCIAINGDENAVINLVFLLRDRAGKSAEAEELLHSIDKKNTDILDSILLNEAIFEYHKNNIGKAEDDLEEALNFIGVGIPYHTTEDWYKFIAALKHPIYLRSVIDVFIRTGYDIVLRPLYEAINALTTQDKVLYLNSVAAEVREPALEIISKIEKIIINK